ncbi:hypothetical protein NX786_06270 [Telluria mixta]|uniref:Transposase n=1 Tax=Telluria mixta TaxID=34071 RepID=A0ABT2BUY5_9BURK|nr:hypothetical protein [Telluria mixta]MCS0628935.1 hypothetical protein [Telluria mixta]
MKLTGIYLYPDLVEYRSDAALAFRNQTRFLCNYVQRHLAARKLHAEGFNRICVVCKSAPAELTYKNTSNALTAEVQFDIAEYATVADERLPEYFIGLLEAGIAKCSKDQHVPAEYFHDAIQSFRAEHYRNEWVFLEKTFRAEGVKCRLKCKLDRSYFRLTLEIDRRGHIIFSQEILRTLPDEVMYAHRFKDIKLDGETLVVQDKFGNALATVPIRRG